MLIKKALNKVCRAFYSLTAILIVSMPIAVQAMPVSYDLTFNTTGQSIWGSGSAYTFDETTFLGIGWQNKQSGINALVGDEDTNVINPLRVAYDVSFAACTVGFSSSACINGQSARAPVVGLGSRPSVRSCGTFAVACKLARVGDISVRALYDGSFATCKLGFSSSVCRNGQSARLPVIALGTAPAAFFTVDTRTGVEVQATSDGRIGLELGIAIDSGSVDATVSYDAQFEIPDTVGLDKTNPINFNSNSLLAGINTLDTTFSTFELSLDAIMELSGSVTAEACVIPAGCTAGGTAFNIDERASVLSFNEDGEGGILLVGQSPSDLGVPIPDGFPISLDIAGLATATLHLPQPNASGGLDVSNTKLTATGQDDLVDLILDLDNIVATSAGVPGLFGSSFGLGALGEVGFDIINVEMGPTIDLKQDFELTPTLFVKLDFDQLVMIGGELVSSLTTAWDLLPDITFLSDATTVTPTFFLEANLLNKTLLDFDLQFGVDLLQVFYDFGLLGAGQFGIGNILDEAIDLFESPDLYNSLFALGGFDLQIGDSFVVDFLLGSSGPATSAARSVVNEVVLPANPDPIPEPLTIALFFIGLLSLFVLRLSTQHKALLLPMTLHYRRI